MDLYTHQCSPIENMPDECEVGPEGVRTDKWVWDSTCSPPTHPLTTDQYEKGFAFDMATLAIKSDGLKYRQQKPTADVEAKCKTIEGMKQREKEFETRLSLKRRMLSESFVKIDDLRESMSEMKKDIVCMNAAREFAISVTKKSLAEQASLGDVLKRCQQSLLLSQERERAVLEDLEETKRALEKILLSRLSQQ
jgi:hypothetical protein